MATREAVALVANDPIISGTFIQSFRQFENQNPSSNSWDNFLVPFLATREVVVPLENNPIISGTSIWLFRHLEHQKVFKGWDNFLVSFLATREAVALLQLILSCRALRYGHLDTLNIKICLQIAKIIFSSIFGCQEGSGATCK